MEIWKSIKDFEGLYEVSNLGRIRTKYWEKRKMSKDPIRKTQISNCGYEMVLLKNNYRQKNCLVHRIVAKTFVDNPKKFNYVHHKDGNKSNNRADNLEWVNMKQHIIDHQGKIIIGFNRITKEIREFKSQTSAAEYIGGKHQNISTSINKKIAVKNWYFFSSHHYYQLFLELNPDLL